jgi:Tol biopolymer transport system component
LSLARKFVLPAVAVGLLLVASPATATFPGSNGKIVFTSPREDYVYRSTAETINPDGSNRAPLLIRPADGSSIAGVYQPQWSADGMRLALGGFPGDQGLGFLYTANADGSNAVAITDEYQEPQSPAWSRDSSRIAFSKFDAFSQFWATELRSINSDGTGLTTIREVTLGQISYPDWSPVRDEIAYVDDGNVCGTGGGWFRTCNAQIWIITPDGTRIRKLGDDKGNDYEPSWSPDGTKIAFTSSRDRPTPEFCSSFTCGDIYMMNADGTGPITRLTDSPGGNTSPVWSPNGKMIAFVSARDGKSEIYVMNADGSGQTNLTNTPNKYEGEPDWQPLPLPAPADFKNAAQFCKAERARLGDAAFRAKYGNNGGCVNQARRS